MASRPRLQIIEGEGVTKTFTVMQGGAVFPLGGYVITLLGRDKNAPKGTSYIEIGASTPGGGGDGVCTVTFAVADTAMPATAGGEAGADILGEFTLRLVQLPVTRYTKIGTLEHNRNDFEA